MVDIRAFLNVFELFTTYLYDTIKNIQMSIMIITLLPPLILPLKPANLREASRHGAIPKRLGKGLQNLHTSVRIRLAPLFSGLPCGSPVFFLRIMGRIRPRLGGDVDEKTGRYPYSVTRFVPKYPYFVTIRRSSLNLGEGVS